MILGWIPGYDAWIGEERLSGLKLLRIFRDIKLNLDVLKDLKKKHINLILRSHEYNTFFWSQVCIWIYRKVLVISTRVVGLKLN